MGYDTIKKKSLWTFFMCYNTPVHLSERCMVYSTANMKNSKKKTGGCTSFTILLRETLQHCNNHSHEPGNDYYYNSIMGQITVKFLQLQPISESTQVWRVLSGDRNTVGPMLIIFAFLEYLYDLQNLLQSPFSLTALSQHGENPSCYSLGEPE